MTEVGEAATCPDPRPPGRAASRTIISNASLADCGWSSDQRQATYHPRQLPALFSQTASQSGDLGRRLTPAPLADTAANPRPFKQGFQTGLAQTDLSSDPGPNPRLPMFLVFLSCKMSKAAARHSNNHRAPRWRLAVITGLLAAAGLALVRDEGGPDCLNHIIMFRSIEHQSCRFRGLGVHSPAARLSRCVRTTAGCKE